MTRKKILTVNERLRETYGTPDLGNVNDVFGELLYALLSTCTAQANYQEAFSRLQSRFPDWKALVESDEHELAEILRPCGLQNRKASAILRIAKRVFIEEGRDNLEYLRDQPTEAVERYLQSFPEVGVKIAKCVVLYALQRPAFPLDTHNLRVLRRLGVVDSDGSARTLAADVESLIPSRIRHDLHVNLVVHGRERCGSQPECSRCVLDDVCQKVGLH